MLETEYIPYENNDREFIDFDRKRLEFWLETVPSDIRRLEYELWKRYRTLVHAGLFQANQEHKTIHPLHTLPFSEDVEKEYWKEFENSFLFGQERVSRFHEIIQSYYQDKDRLLNKIPKNISEKDIKLVALGGSSFYGPRKHNTPWSDIDIHILLDMKDDNNNFEIFPSRNSEEQLPYHIIGTGTSDQARGRGQIHWLLYPHYPLENKMPNDEVKSIITGLVEDTRLRIDGINEETSLLDEKIAHEREKDYHAWTK